MYSYNLILQTNTETEQGALNENATGEEAAEEVEDEVHGDADEIEDREGPQIDTV